MLKVKWRLFQYSTSCHPWWEIINNEDVYKYDVYVAYKNKDLFKVSLKNESNNHEQIILKNKEGVYVKTQESTKQKLNVI